MLVSLPLRMSPMVLLLLAGIARATIADRRPDGWPSTAPSDVNRGGHAIQVTRTMTLELAADADRAFPLFGVVRESEWSPDWAPSFLVPAEPAQSQDGAVFTTGDPESPTTWVMTDYDPRRHVVRYVHVRPGHMLAQLWIQVRASSAHSASADVTYRCTALGPEGHADIEHFRGAFPSFQHHWESAIGAALAGSSSHSR